MSISTLCIHEPKNYKTSILLIYTGGTFGMVADENTLGMQQVNWLDLKGYFPALGRIEAKVDLLWLGDAMDSSDVQPVNWIRWSELIKKYYNAYNGFIFIHGTDTMAFSASALSFCLEGLQKPVIFTGAQLPISAIRSDARDNLLSSIEMACMKDDDGLPYIREVCIYFNNKLLRGNRTKKIQSSQFDAFEAPNYGSLAETGINIDFKKHKLFRSKSSDFEIKNVFASSVANLKLYPGISVDSYSYLLDKNKVKGLILETYGSGNAPHMPILIDTLKKTILNGCMVLNISQCTQGNVVQSRYETGKQLEDIGVISGKDITFEAAITKMMWTIGNFPESEWRDKLSTSQRGEMN